MFCILRFFCCHMLEAAVSVEIEAVTYTKCSLALESDGELRTKHQLNTV